jgi:hypothetical protein
MHQGIPHVVGGGNPPFKPTELQGLTDAAEFAAKRRRLAPTPQPACARTKCGICGAPTHPPVPCGVCQLDALGHIATSLRRSIASSPGGVEGVPDMGATDTTMQRWLDTVGWLTADHMQRLLGGDKTLGTMLLVLEGAMYARRLSTEEQSRFAPGYRVLKLIFSHK